MEHLGGEVIGFRDPDTYEIQMSTEILLLRPIEEDILFRRGSVGDFIGFSYDEDSGTYFLNEKPYKRVQND